jgi:hypothetical protein
MNVDIVNDEFDKYNEKEDPSKSKFFLNIVKLNKANIGPLDKNWMKDYKKIYVYKLIKTSVPYW